MEKKITRVVLTGVAVCMISITTVSSVVTDV